MYVTVPDPTDASDPVSVHRTDPVAPAAGWAATSSAIMTRRVFTAAPFAVQVADDMKREIEPE